MNLLERIESGEWLPLEEFDEVAFLDATRARATGTFVLHRNRCGGPGVGPGCGRWFVGYARSTPERCPVCGTRWAVIDYVGVSRPGDPPPDPEGAGP